MWCGQRYSNPLVGAFYSLCISTLYHFMQIKPPTSPAHPFPSSPLTHFLLFKEEALDYLTPPVWTSHLPIFLPMDHQPAGVVTEGEILRSTSPQQLPFCPLAACNVWLMHLRRSECHFQLYSCGFLSSTTDEAPSKSSFSVEMPGWMPSMSQFYHCTSVSVSLLLKSSSQYRRVPVIFSKLLCPLLLFIFLYSFSAKTRLHQCSFNEAFIFSQCCLL